MKNGWILLSIFLVCLSGFAFAQTAASITSSPYVINPSTTPNIGVNFTLTNPTFIVGPDTYDLRFYLSDNTTYELGTDVELAGSATTFASLTCGGDILTSGATCTHTFSVGSQTDASKYIIMEATLNAITPTQSNAVSILFDSTPPSASITNTTSPLVGTFVGTLFPTFAIAGNAGSGSNLTIGALSINGHDRVLTFSGNNATYTAVAEDGLVAGQNYTVSVNNVTDAAGNASTTPTTVSFTIDTTAPANPAATSGASANFTNDKTPSITVSADDGAGAGNLVALIRCDGGSEPTPKTMNGNSFTIEDFDVTTGPNCSTSDGTKTIKVKIKDGVGNTSSEVSVSIKYDGTKPNIPGNVGSDDVETTTALLEWTAPTDSTSGIDNYRMYRGTSDSFSSATDLGTTSDTSKSLSGLTACTTYFVWVTARDNAGNVSDPQSSAHSFTTKGCSTNTNTNSGNNGGGNNGGGSGPSSGGPGSCTVTFDIPTSIYAGETIVAKASGSNYVNGQLYGYEAGKLGKDIKVTPTAATSWSGDYVVPNAIGKTVTFRFKAEGCISAPTNRSIKDPKTKPATTAPAPKQTTPSGSGNGETILDEPEVLPAQATVSLSVDKISELMTFAGFNAENTEQRTTMEALISGMGLIETIHAVPSAVEGKYQLQIVLQFVNTGNHGSLKVVQQIPKGFAESASMMESNYPMTILQDDPLVQITADGLKEGESFRVLFTTKESYTIEAANAKVEKLKDELTTPPLLFASGKAAAANNDGLAAISGLVGAAGATAPFVLGFVLVLGLIFVSIRVVRGSVEGTNNPILRSASQANQRGGRMVNTTVNGKKRFAQNKPGDAA